jgi:hypothetical protein
MERPKIVLGIGAAPLVDALLDAAAHNDARKREKPQPEPRAPAASTG